ncbi:phage holin family protein [Xylella fastidiosa]|uniref:phage holin family protein n=1 Tax=Xylella fastidiosa TaxID=2371 RepID=UPI000765A744|nr:phage holin family protein [Xylella fastidiosa]KXB19928.1 hypothetical protein ADT30_08415 [Xylella fastidiosa]
MIDVSTLPTWWPEAFYVALSLLTGTLSYVMRVIDAKQTLAVSRVLIEAAMSGFVGLLVMCVCEEFKLSQSITVAAVIASGLIDTPHTLELIQNFIAPKLGTGGK